MALNRRLTTGLAWAGVALIFAVPSAEMISARMAPSEAALPIGAPAQVPPAPAKVDPVTTAAIEPAKLADPVEKFILTGKPLPDYLSGGDATAARSPAAPASGLVLPVAPAKPQPLATPAQESAKVQVATVAPVKPPIPMAATMRPRFRPPVDQPLILDEAEVLSREALASPAPVYGPETNDRVVDADQLEEWDSGSLFDYLERRGLINDEPRSEASFEDSFLEDEYDADGFFLSDGPNNRRRFRDRDGFVVFLN